MKISHAQMNHQPLTTTQSQQSQASAAVTSKKEASATNEPLSEAPGLHTCYNGWYNESQGSDVKLIS